MNCTKPRRDGWSINSNIPFKTVICSSDVTFNNTGFYLLFSCNVNLDVIASITYLAVSYLYKVLFLAVTWTIAVTICTSIAPVIFLYKVLFAAVSTILSFILAAIQSYSIL